MWGEPGKVLQWGDIESEGDSVTDEKERILLSR